jgi:hypothetical protein
VIATAPAERRGELVARAREGRSTYSLRERRETTAVAAGEATERADEDLDQEAGDEHEPRARELAQALGSSVAETRAFALELLSVLMRSSAERVKGSLEQFRAAQRPAGQRS